MAAAWSIAAYAQESATMPATSGTTASLPQVEVTRVKAVDQVARAEADGYTLLLVGTPHAINTTLYAKLNVNVAEDIAPVASISNGSFVMVVSPLMPAKTVPEFIAYAKANPGKINMASSGSGNLSHLSGELFRMMTGIAMVHVPYRGAPAAHSGLMAGDRHRRMTESDSQRS
jgi:tripartite-type tricarboxylate transporter receptor subunit TctC